jgi:hypothetical protein
MKPRINYIIGSHDSSGKQSYKHRCIDGYNSNPSQPMANTADTWSKTTTSGKPLLAGSSSKKRAVEFRTMGHTPMLNCETDRTNETGYPTVPTPTSLMHYEK